MLYEDSSLWDYATAYFSEYFIVALIALQLAWLAGQSVLVMIGQVKTELKMAADTATLTGTSTGVATAGGWLEWVNTYSPALTVIISAVSAIIAAVFYYLNYRFNKERSDEEMRKELREEILKEIEGQ